MPLRMNKHVIAMLNDKPDEREKERRKRYRKDMKDKTDLRHISLFLPLELIYLIDKKRLEDYSEKSRNEYIKDILYELLNDK